MNDINILKIRSITLVSIVLIIGIVIALCRACSSKEEQIGRQSNPVNEYRLNSVIKNEHSASDEFVPMEKYILRWMEKNGFRGASLAIMKDEKLIYCKGLGWADAEKQIPAEAGNIFRMASASKLITAIAIMKLCEEGKLSLDDKVFGPEGILSQYTEYQDKRTEDIKVRHLLIHTSGFSRKWGDLMFRPLDVIKWAGLDHAPTAEDIIKLQLGLKLRDKPGNSSQYSNVGYLVLSEVIEKRSGLSYEQYVIKHILKPAGCYDLHLARNEYEQRYPNEVKYYGHDEGELVESYDCSGRMCLREYGGYDIRGLKGAGAWVGSSAEMMRLIASIDGKDGVPDILSAKSINAMKTPIREGEDGYGWAQCRSNGVLVRTGTMSGTCAYIEYNPKGYSFIFIANTSHFKGATFTRKVGNVIKEGMLRVKSWPTDIDLFTAPPAPKQTTEEQKEENRNK